MMITSPLMHDIYAREVPDYEAYQQRSIEIDPEQVEQEMEIYTPFPDPV